MTVDFESRKVIVQKRINDACNQWLGTMIYKDILTTVRNQVITTLGELVMEKLIMPANYQVTVKLKGSAIDLGIFPEIQIISDYKNRRHKIRDFYNSQNNREIALIVDNGKRIVFKINEDLLETEDPLEWVYFERIHEYEKLIGSELFDIRFCPQERNPTVNDRSFIRSFRGPIREDDKISLGIDGDQPMYHEYGYDLVTNDGIIRVSAISYYHLYHQDFLLLEGW